MAEEKHKALGYLQKSDECTTTKHTRIFVQRQHTKEGEFGRFETLHAITDERREAVRYTQKSVGVER